MANDAYTVWYKTASGQNSGKKSINLQVEDFAGALTQAEEALSDMGWTLTAMRTYNNTTDKTGLAFIYDVELTVDETALP